MNRFLLFALLWCFSSAICRAQDYETCKQVISAMGKTATQGGLTFSYTVGEPVITTLFGNARILTQGFHQPEQCAPVATESPYLADWNIEVYPNPTSDFLTIRFSNEKTNSLRASIVNLYGQVMMYNTVLDKPEGTLLDCSNWQPGVYILQLQDDSTPELASVRFIRL